METMPNISTRRDNYGPILVLVLSMGEGNLLNRVRVNFFNRLSGRYASDFRNSLMILVMAGTDIITPQIKIQKTKISSAIYAIVKT
jgi:hypothetical protein